jgi:single-stranded DNA-binding protein
MNEVTITGKVKFVDEVREFGSNGFRKHQVVVETGDGRWDNPIPVEFTKDNIELSKNLQVGDQVKIESRINGREWQGKDGTTKWFTSINGYKITKESSKFAEESTSSFDTYDEYAEDLEEDVF